MVNCKCVISLCRNNYKTRNTDKSVKYFPFPKNTELRAKWNYVCGLTETFTLEKNYICAEHFLETDFERDLKAELMNLPPKKILKPDAIPSLNILKPYRITEDLSNIIRQNKSESTIVCKENQENSSKISEPNGACNGFIISYLGSPRFLITSNPKNTDEFPRISSNSQTKIISVDPENFPADVYEQNITNIDTFGTAMTEKNVFKLDELCRLCGCYSNRMKSIFENHSQICYSEIINSHFPDIKVNKDDILPVQICSRCESNLVTWYQFFKTCNAVNKRFQSILKKLSPFQHSDRSKDNSKSFVEAMEIQEEMNDDTDLLFDDDSIKEIEIVEISPEVEETEPLEMFSEVKVETCVAEPTPEGNEQQIKYSEEEKYDVLDNRYSEVDVKIENIPEKTESIECGGIEYSEQLQEDKLQRSPRLTRIKSCEIFKGTARRRKRRRMATLNLRRMCHICGKIFKYPESLRRHLKTVHSDERPFKCHLCTSSFNRNHNLTIHIKVVHQHQRVYTKKHVQRLCDYCGKVLLSARSLEEHISSIHTKKALYECTRCTSTFYRKLLYDRHHTSGECDIKNPRKCNAPKSEEVFLKYCEFCGLEFKKEHFYTKHQLKHMNNFVCSICSINFEDGTLLKEHVNTEHPEVKPFECDACGKKFKNKSLLNCHLVIHTGEKRYECQYCSLKFLKKKYLSTHILTHTGERPFTCTICGKAFKQSGDMRKHKATHIKKPV